VSTVLTLVLALLLAAPKSAPQPDPTEELFSRSHVLRPLADGYAVSGTSGGVGVYAVTQGCELTQVGRLVLPSAVRDIAVQGKLVYAALGPQGLAVVDVTNPEKPLLVTRLATDRAINLLTLEGKTLHAASGTLGVTVFDLSRPKKPKVAKTFALPGLTGRPFVDGDRVLVPTSGLCAYTRDSQQPTCRPGPRVDTVFRLGGQLFASSGLDLCPVDEAATTPLTFDAPTCVKLPERLRAALPLGDTQALLAAGTNQCPKLEVKKCLQPSDCAAGATQAALLAGPATPGTCVNLDATPTLLFLATDAGGPKCEKRAP
jgi:hypothetical protein